MSEGPDWKGIAARIKGLIGMSDRGKIAMAAARLGVTERELRETLARRSTSSALKVVGAVVRLYGLDPTWVMTGKYDPATHRAALGRDDERIDDALTSLSAEHPLPTHGQEPATPDA